MEEPIVNLKNIILKQQRLIEVKHGGGELRYVAPLKQIGENLGNPSRVLIMVFCGPSCGAPDTTK